MSTSFSGMQMQPNLPRRHCQGQPTPGCTHAQRRTLRSNTSNNPVPSRRERLLLIPGLDCGPTLVQAAAPRPLQGMRVLAFDHGHDAMAGGVEGLAERALAVLDTWPGPR